MESQQGFQYFISNFQFQNLNPYFFFPIPQVTMVASIDKSESDKYQKCKYKRTWKKNQVEKLYEITKQYAQEINKEIEDLTILDFAIISKQTEQSPDQCMAKINEIQVSGTLRPGIWSEKEDVLLTELVLGPPKKWGHIANIINNNTHKELKIRTGKHCKERWNNHLNPEIKRGIWTTKEDDLLLDLHKKFGNKWSAIAKSVGQRTECAVKNRIKSLLNKKRQELQTFDAPIKSKEEETPKETLFVPHEANGEKSASPRSGIDYSIVVKSPSFSDITDKFKLSQ